MTLLITTLVLLFFPDMVSAQEKPSELESVRINVNHDDGGKTGKRHLRDLLDALNKAGCNAILDDASAAVPAQIIFDSRPVSVVNKQRPDYRLIARAKTLYGALEVRGAILVHASRGITDLSVLKGEWISFVSKKSWSGYLLPLQLLQEAGVNENSNTFYFVDNHVGAVSALMHKDVLVAVIAEPLAQRWAKLNDLSIVAVTNAVETGGWWMHRSVSEKLTQDCAQAMTTLDRSQHKALPAWIDGFVIPDVKS